MPRVLDEKTFLGMLRYSLATGIDRLVLRPGYRPLVDGMGGPRELGWRQVTRDDTDAAAGLILGGLMVPEKARSATDDGACELVPLFEIPGEALIEAEFRPARGGLAVHLDLIRPVPEAVLRAELEESTF